MDRAKKVAASQAHALYPSRCRAPVHRRASPPTPGLPPSLGTSVPFRSGASRAPDPRARQLAQVPHAFPLRRAPLAPGGRGAPSPPVAAPMHPCPPRRTSIPPPYQSCEARLHGDSEVVCYDTGDEDNEAGTHRCDRIDAGNRYSLPTPSYGPRTSRAPLMLLTQGDAGGVRNVAVVAPPAPPNPSWLRPSARVSRSPHSHPKEIVPEDHTERGPSSTILCPHSSHTRMPPLEGSFTS